MTAHTDDRSTKIKNCQYIIVLRVSLNTDRERQNKGSNQSNRKNQIKNNGKKDQKTIN